MVNNITTIPENVFLDTSILNLYKKELITNEIPKIENIQEFVFKEHNDIEINEDEDNLIKLLKFNCKNIQNIKLVKNNYGDYNVDYDHTQGCPISGIKHDQILCQIKKNNKDQFKLFCYSENCKGKGIILKENNEIADEKIPLLDEIIKQIKKDIETDDMNDNTMAKIFVKMSNDNIKVINDKGDGYCWDETKKLWFYKTAGDLMLLISNSDGLLMKALSIIIIDYKNELSALDPKDPYKMVLKKNLKSSNLYKNKIQSASGVKNIFTFAKASFKDENFLNIINRNHDLFPLNNNCVIDLITGETRERTKEDLFSLECNVNYIKESEWTNDDIELHKKFINQILMDDEDYIKYNKIKMGSYLSGRCLRDIDINHGYGCNGKSSIIKAFQTIMGDFMGFIGKNVIVFDPKSKKAKGGGNHTSHLIPIEGKRLIITQELEENDTIDSEMIKKIASADPIEGVRECYGTKTRTIYPFCKLLVQTNKIPKFDTQDTAIIDRLCFNPYNSRFLNKVDLELEKTRGKYDPSKYKYYNADNEVVEQYTHSGRAINIFFSWLVGGCMEFYKLRHCGIQKPKIVLDYIENKIGENDIIGQWINENCDVVNGDDWKTMEPKERKFHITLATDLYNEFSEWAKENECHAGLGKIKFNSYLKDKFTRNKTNKGFVYERITLSVGDTSMT